MKRMYLLTEKQLSEIIAQESEKNRKLYAEALQAEVSNKQMSLTSLQNQINPHFLYNALECIRGRAILDNAPAIVEMSEALARFFRYSISTKSNIVTVKEELDNVQNYLRIQQYRFNDRFGINIKCNTADEINKALIPKLTLQPVIENSIQHGFEKKLGRGNITIDIVATQKNINILISDDGVGISKEKLKILNDRISNYDVLDSRGNTKEHIGLAMPNINKRIQLFFGEDYGIHVASVENVGTDIEIHIPRMYAEEKGY